MVQVTLHMTENHGQIPGARQAWLSYELSLLAGLFSSSLTVRPRVLVDRGGMLCFVKMLALNQSSMLGMFKGNVVCLGCFRCCRRHVRSFFQFGGWLLRSRFVCVA